MKQNMQNQTIYDLYTDHKKSKYPSNPKSEKNYYEKLYIKETTSKASTAELTAELFSKVS